MKAEIGRDGTLHLIPESMTDSFALDKWAEGAKVKLLTTDIDLKLMETEYWRGSRIKVALMRP